MNTLRIGVVTVAIALLTTTGWFAAGSAVAGQDKSMPDPAQFARGAKAWANTCGQCHNLRDPKEFSDKSWDVIVNHMRTVAPLPGGEAGDIKAFLKASN